MSQPYEWNIAFGYQESAMFIHNLVVNTVDNKINGYDIPEGGFGFTIEELLEYSERLEKTRALEEENEMLKTEAEEYKDFIEKELKSVIERLNEDDSTRGH